MRNFAANLVVFTVRNHAPICSICSSSINRTKPSIVDDSLHLPMIALYADADIPGAKSPKRCVQTLLLGPNTDSAITRTEQFSRHSATGGRGRLCRRRTFESPHPKPGTASHYRNIFTETPSAPISLPHTCLSLTGVAAAAMQPRCATSLRTSSVLGLPAHDN